MNFCLAWGNIDFDGLFDFLVWREVVVNCTHMVMYVVTEQKRRKGTLGSKKKRTPANVICTSKIKKKEKTNQSFLYCFLSAPPPNRPSPHNHQGRLGWGIFFLISGGTWGNRDELSTNMDGTRSSNEGEGESRIKQKIGSR